MLAPLLRTPKLYIVRLPFSIKPSNVTLFQTCGTTQSCLCTATIETQLLDCASCQCQSDPSGQAQLQNAFDRTPPSLRFYRPMRNLTLFRPQSSPRAARRVTSHPSSLGPSTAVAPARASLAVQAPALPAPRFLHLLQQARPPKPLLALLHLLLNSLADRPRRVALSRPSLPSPRAVPRTPPVSPPLPTSSAPESSRLSLLFSLVYSEHTFHASM